MHVFLQNPILIRNNLSPSLLSASACCPDKITNAVLYGIIQFKSKQFCTHPYSPDGICNRATVFSPTTSAATRQGTAWDLCCGWINPAGTQQCELRKEGTHRLTDDDAPTQQQASPTGNGKRLEDNETTAGE